MLSLSLPLDFIVHKFLFDSLQLLNVLLFLNFFDCLFLVGLRSDLLHEFGLHLFALVKQLLFLFLLFVPELGIVLLNDVVPLLFGHARGLTLVHATELFQCV